MWHLRQAADPRAQEQGRGLGLLPGPSYPLGQDREAAKDEIYRAYGSPVDQRQRNSLRQNGVREERYNQVVHAYTFTHITGFLLGTSFQARRATQQIARKSSGVIPPLQFKAERQHRARDRRNATHHAIFALALRAPALRRWHADRELTPSDSRDPGSQDHLYLGLHVCLRRRRSPA